MMTFLSDEVLYFDLFYLQSSFFQSPFHLWPSPILFLSGCLFLFLIDVFQVQRIYYRFHCTSSFLDPFSINVHHKRLLPAFLHQDLEVYASTLKFLDFNFIFYGEYPTLKEHTKQLSCSGLQEVWSKHFFNFFKYVESFFGHSCPSFTPI